MQINHQIFLLTAQELSVSRAANIACVTQQCASDHIKRLEAQFNTRLFIRKPRLQLTSAGEMMYQALKKIYSIETDLAKCMEQYRTEAKGSFTVGINSSRASVVLPLVLPKFYELFPLVEVKFIMEDTIGLFHQMEHGNIDLYFGIQSPYSKEFSYQHICEEELCIIISHALLTKHLGADVDVSSEQIALSKLIEVPFTRSFQTSALKHIMDEFLAEQHLTLVTPYNISDTYTQIALCIRGFSAGLCPRMLLGEVTKHNRTANPDEYIHILSIEGLNRGLRIELVKKQDYVYPKYVEAFSELVISTLQAEFPLM